MNRYLKANILTETGKPTKLLLPPNASRIIPVSPLTGHGPKVHRLLVVAYDTLALRSIFVIPQVFRSTDTITSVILYNGSHETNYIQHDLIVAEVADL